MNKELERLLPLVQKPGRYTAGELNSVVKDRGAVELRYAFCFPDTYEIGMSHLGMKIIYSLVNDREDAWCERVFAPWTDMEEQLRKNGVPLFALESGDALTEFDVVGFTLQYEMSYTNVLNMLDLAGIPLRSRDRQSLTPLVIAGGPCVCNAEPMAPFFDVILPGEGEEVTNELLDLLKLHKRRGSSKQEFLLEAAKIKGVYVPEFYETLYNDDGTMARLRALFTAPAAVEKRVVENLDTASYPEKFIVPFIEVVHDRAVAEIFRGCIRGCRFCQACFIYRPIREKSSAKVNEQCRSICASTGYDEVSLCSLSTSDYRQLGELLDELLDWTAEEKVNVSLPSLRADNFSSELTEKLARVRRSGLTFAPEAGTQRLRDVINKNITEQEVLSAARKAFEGGWTSVKLYFMLGLPTETDKDLEGIAELAQKVVDEFYSNPDKPKGKGVNVSISVASFVPKPFTPFQWEPQVGLEEMRRRQKLIMESIRSRKITYSFHNAETSFIEGVLARGDRRLADVIELTWKKGASFDSWDDHFSFERWLEAFEECGLNPEFYACRRREYGETLPWDHMDYGVSKAFLERESRRAGEGLTTPCCREKCAGCGANRLNGGKCNEIG